MHITNKFREICLTNTDYWRNTFQNNSWQNTKSDTSPPDGPGAASTAAPLFLNLRFNLFWKNTVKANIFYVGLASIHHYIYYSWDGWKHKFEDIHSPLIINFHIQNFHDSNQRHQIEKNLMIPLLPFDKINNWFNLILTNTIQIAQPHVTNDYHPYQQRLSRLISKHYLKNFRESWDW